MAENEEELKSLLMRLKEAAEKVDLKFNVKKAKIMTVGPHHFMVKRRGKSRCNDIFFGGGGSKITVDSDYSHEVKRRFLIGRKAMTNLKSIKSRDILTTKIHTVKVTFFPIVTYSCESWTLKKAEH